MRESVGEEAGTESGGCRLAAEHTWASEATGDKAWRKL